MEIVIAIAAKIAEYTVGPVGQWLCYSCHFNINIENLKNQEKNLRDAKNRVQHLIDAASRNGEEIEDDVKTWLIRADHITELATTKLHEIEEEAGTGSSNAACLNLKHRHQLSREAKKIAENIAELVKNGNFDRVSYRPASEGMEMTRNMDYNYMAMVSRMTMVKEIMEALGNADIDKIGVWGMPGVGKSTLMKEIARQAKEEKLFNEVVMTMVTNSPDVRRIQGAIAYKLDLNFDQEADEKDRASHLQRRLSKDKKVLVILDDIWKAFDLQEMGIPSKGCKVVMISRDRDVLISGMDTQKAIHELKILQKDEAWNLFEKMAGDSFQDRPEVRGIATKIAEKCAGLPIALVIVSKALKNKSLGIWKDALVQLTRPAPENDSKIWSPIYSCIHLSYEHLVGEEVKSLFLLCAQQDYYIFYQDLLRYGFGLGLFLNIYTLEEARNRLESLLSNLQDSCLLLESPHSSKEFNMHDLVRDVAKIIASKNHNMFVMRDDGGQKAWPDVDALNRCEALSIHGGDIHKHPNKMECPKLRFFHVDCKDTLNLKIPNIFFQGMEKLEVLSLRNMQLSSLFPLTNLQTLCLDGCMLGDIHGIGELKNLVILSLARSDISNLLREIGSLTRLRLLDLSNCSKLRVIPPNVLSSLVNLEELYMRKTYVQWEVEGPSNEGKNASLAELKKLSHLITLEIHIRNGMKLPKDLFSKKLERYKIRIGDIMPWETFNGATFSRTLKLKLNGSFQLDSGIKMLLKRTEYLYLDESNRTESVLYELNREDFQQLKHLHIQNSGNIKHIPKLRTPAIAFPILETFVLKHMISLEEICQGNLPFTSFKSLKVLNVENCKKLRFIFSSSIARGLSLLEELNITRCNNVGAIFMKEEEDGIEDQEDMMLFGRLQTLVLKDLPKLVGFLSTKDSFMTDCRETNSEGNHDLQLPLLHHHQLSFPNLKILHLRGLSKIKHVWSNVNGCESLKSLEIHDCGAMEEIVAREDGTDPTTRLLFPSLNYLRLDGLPKLKWFFQGVCTLESSSSKELHGQGGTLFGPEEIAFPNLTNLNLRNLPKIKHVWNKDPQTILRFQNLQHITASRCKRLKSLFPASVGSCLKQLKTITIDDFCGMEEIVKVEGGEAARRTLVFVFPQVTYLSLSYLPRLECFYKGVHISKWPMLKKIKIEKCNKVEVFASGLVSEETVEKRQSQMSIKQPIFLVDEMSFPSLEILNISIMKKLEIIWYGLVAASPTRLDISNCDSLEAVYEEHEGQDGKESHALTTTQLLRAMSLYSLPKMRNIWNIKDCHQRHMYSFPNLLDIDVKGCESLKSLFPAASVAASLPQLQSLKIHDCGVMEEIVAREDGADPSTRLLFPSLTLLRLDGLPKLEWFFQGVRTLESSSSSKELHEQGGTLFGIEEMSFPSLEILKIRRMEKLEIIWNMKDSHQRHMYSFPNLLDIDVKGCESLKSLFPAASVAASLPQLQSLKIHDCGVMEEIVAREDGTDPTTRLLFPSLNFLSLDELPKLKWFFQGLHTLELSLSKELHEQGGTLFGIEEVAFPNLTELHLCCLAKIKHVWSKDPQTIQRFQNLQKIIAWKCASLKSLLPASVDGCLKQLKKIIVYDCGVEEIVGAEGGEVVGRTLVFVFPQVAYLYLANLPRLESFYNGVHISKWPMLKKMSIEGCKKVEVFASGLVREETVEKRQSQMSIKQPIFLVDEMSFPSLEILKIRRMEELEMIWNMKDCYQRHMYSFPNLLEINVKGCESLKSLFPAASVAASLPQLQSLKIHDCGVMEEIVVREDGTDPTTRLLFPSLNFLSLDELPKLKWFFQGLRTLESSLSKELHEQGGTLFGIEEVAFPNLTELHICGLAKIKHVWSKDPQTILRFQNLQEINAQKCASLKSLFPTSVDGCLKQLKKIRINKCGVEEIVGDECGEAVGRTLVFVFPQVTSLDLANLPRLECFYKGVHISKWPMLESMSIEGCEKVEVFASGLVNEETVEERQSHISIKQSLFLDKMSFPSLEI
ncbi:uncharacterized protein LOC122318860 isoform X3 [Carya illinoinensis]|uniref:AAA+ ATPase domain-containing protein n=1 Tax=Carya illinoinensis TaxID=32201 RepID=A0A8T1PSU7_CARIL|nr:uncharacterized protein LOC122318860 isoform X3 [Carya illinoinensis]KAG6646175.1 hypothetical protein CIPAW_08G175500 [Carya illinoinensis]